MCCVHIVKTDDGAARIDQKVAYLRNPAFPQADTMDRMQTVSLIPRDNDTMQFLVELIDFKVSKGYILLLL